MANKKDDEDFATMFDEAPDGPASTDGDDYDDEPGYGLDAAPHERDAKEAEAEFNRLTEEEASASPVSVPGEINAKPIPAQAALEGQVAPKTNEDWKPKTFGDAFKRARSEGVSKFEWNGKSYTTRLKGEAPSTTTTLEKASTTKWAGTTTSTKQPSAPLPAPKEAARTPIATPLAQPEMPSNEVEGVSPPTTESRHSQLSAPGASGAELRSHRIRLQKAYDIWQEAKDANSTWYGGKAVMRPGMKERETEAEQQYLNLLRNPR